MKRVIVTGGYGVLGAAVARAFAEAGASVALVDVADSPAPPLAMEFTAPHRLVGGVDLADLASTRAAFTSIADTWSGIDVLVNVAGGFQWERLDDGDVETWDRMYSMNLRTAVTACKAALPWLVSSGAGRIVNVGAGAAARASAGTGAYAASKSGVQRLTEALAAELRDRSVTVNAVLPGTIDTPRNRADMPQADVSRWVAPAQIAAVIRFLATAEASAVTGAAIPVYGRGWS